MASTDEKPIAHEYAKSQATLAYCDVPASVVHVKPCMLDSLGVGLASTRFEFGPAVITAARDLGGAGVAGLTAAAITAPDPAAQIRSA